MNKDRYGSDALSFFLSIVALVAAISASVFKEKPFSILLISASIALLVMVVYRIMSKNKEKREKENKAFLSFFKGSGNKEPYKYFSCPSCHTKIRVPRGKGKIKIKCPKCNHEFIKRT